MAGTQLPFAASPGLPGLALALPFPERWPTGPAPPAPVRVRDALGIRRRSAHQRQRGEQAGGHGCDRAAGAHRCRRCSRIGVALRARRDARARLHDRNRLRFLQADALARVGARARDARDLGQVVPGIRSPCRFRCRRPVHAGIGRDVEVLTRRARPRRGPIRSTAWPIRPMPARPRSPVRIHRQRPAAAPDY